MREVWNIGIGVAILILGYFIGNYLSKITSEELKAGQQWFKLILIISLIGGILSLILKADAFLYTFLLILVITSRSLR